MVVANLAMAFERTDEVVLPAVYSFVAASFGANLLQLSYLSMARALTQALLSPLGGFLGHTYNRVAVISLGCFVWGATMFGFAFSTTLAQGIIAWAITGLGLCLVIPNVQSLTADLYPEAHRGKAFGTLQMSSALGAALGGLYATNVGGARPFGWDGWRFAMLLLGVVAVAIGLLNLALSADPRAASRGSLRLAPPPGAHGRDANFWQDLIGVLRTPTFLIIVAQGIVGNIPMMALSFQTLYLQLLQISNAWASVAVSSFMGAQAGGGLLGGWVGDAAARWSPRHGRILTSQASVAMGAVLTAITLRGLPRANAPAYVGAYVAVSVINGLLNSWPAPACNNPIFAEIVPASHRNIVYAFDRSFEMALASLAGGPVVSLLSMKLFGFSDEAAATGDPAIDLPKADALSQALLLMTAIPWAACVLTYTGAHWTYPRDKRAVDAAAADAIVIAANGSTRERRSPVQPDRRSLDNGALCEGGDAASRRGKVTGGRQGRS